MDTNTNTVLNSKAFKKLLQEYIVPLFDVENELILCNEPEANSGYVSCARYSERDMFKYSFYPVQNNSLFHFELLTLSTDRLKKPVSDILQELMVAYKINLSALTAKTIYEESLFDTAFEMGICRWLTTTTEDSSTLYSIISNLKKWTGRTYEGENVPFCIVVDFSAPIKNNGVNYLQFLKNNNCAVFTDGVFSGVLIDRFGNLISYITNETFSGSTEQKLFVPYPNESISKYCGQNSVGIIVLANGEILLIKKNAIKFAWRGNKWVFFDWRRACDRIEPYFRLNNGLTPNMISNYVKEIYCTLLDVSFSHSGGCLCIIAPTVDSRAINSIVKERIDLEEKIESINDINAEKCSIVKSMIANSESGINAFFTQSKPLRKEMLAMDGATAVYTDGRICCTGSIVSVDGSSTGGGRTAAAKNLAKLGLGIKISEDGTIEAYGAEIINSSISENEPKKLFKIG